MIEIDNDTAEEIIDALGQLDETHQCDELIKLLDAKLDAAHESHEMLKLFPEC